MSPNNLPDEVKRFSIEGASCAGCVRKIENGLANIEGVASASLNFADRSLCVAGTLEEQAIIDAVSAMGYGATPQPQSSLQQQEAARDLANANELKTRKHRSLVALILGAVLMAWGMHAGMMINTPLQSQQWSLAGLITGVIMVFSGRSIYSIGWRSLRHLAPSMDTLVSLGTLAAWLYSMGVALFYAHLPEAGRHVYFEASVMILGFVNLGRYLEVKARSRASDAIKDLLKRQVDSAILVSPTGDRVCPVEAIAVGKHIRIKPGANIPLDGVITEGHALVDESMLTGEPLPVEKTLGDAVFAGCINGASSFIVQVTKRSNDSSLANIIRAVKNAQGAKPAIGKLADQISSWFVPVIMVIAALSASIWYTFGPSPQMTYAMIIAVTVLIIACPCALGLATPMSVMVAVGKAARSGILIRNGDALQAASAIDTLIIDKTGTLTHGKPVVVNANYDNDYALQLALALESHSEHPLAHAIIEFCNKQHTVAADISEIKIAKGMGIEAQHNGLPVYLGSERYLQQHGINVEGNKSAFSEVYLALNGQIIASFSIDDTVRDDTALSIKLLQQQGIEVIIASGDSEGSVARIAEMLGIPKWHARVLPDEKQRLVATLQSDGRSVAMAGDGINDAPALALANISFAMGSGTDVALSSADVVMMHNSLHNIVDAIAISRATLTNIKQNLFWAFAYNAISIPIAAGVLYPFTGTLLNPMIAGLAMALSSVTVVTNANRLR